MPEPRLDANPSFGVNPPMISDGDRRKTSSEDLLKPMYSSILYQVQISGNQNLKTLDLCML